jgi:hypothetical protein
MLPIFVLFFLVLLFGVSLLFWSDAQQFSGACRFQTEEILNPLKSIE